MSSPRTGVGDPFVELSNGDGEWLSADFARFVGGTGETSCTNRRKYEFFVKAEKYTRVRSIAGFTLLKNYLRSEYCINTAFLCTY